jgi:hypothetical protein
MELCDWSRIRRDIIEVEIDIQGICCQLIELLILFLKFRSLTFLKSIGTWQFCRATCLIDTCHFPGLLHFRFVIH